MLCSQECDPELCSICKAKKLEEYQQQENKRIELLEQCRQEALAEAKRIREYYETHKHKTTTKKVKKPEVLHHLSDLITRFGQSLHGCVLVLEEAYQVVNPALHEEWLQARTELNDPVSAYRSLFHGTGKEGIEGIAEEGFRLPPEDRVGMFGRGIYFATDSTKSAQEIYTKGTNTIILCDVWLGKSYPYASLTVLCPHFGSFSLLYLIILIVLKKLAHPWMLIN
jgi:Poly(ADP-ribose) polymerase catalytic domain